MSDRVLHYFNAIADTLEAAKKMTASIQNSGDIGYSRERLVRDFLQKHLPNRLTAFLGGHIFGYDQPDSKQIDIIVSNDIGLNFKEHEKPFSPIENVCAAFSVKSTLDSTNLKDCLQNIASIPQIDPQALKFTTLHPTAFDRFIKHNPTFYVFAYDGISLETTLSSLEEFYLNFQVPYNRRPRGIIVNKKFYIKYSTEDSDGLDGKPTIPYTFSGIELQQDVQGYPFFHIFNCINSYSEWMLSMSIDYKRYFNSALRTFQRNLA
jgi:hypothetical protein